MAMEEVALYCMQMGVGYNEFASQVEESKAACGYPTGYAHPFVCVPTCSLALTLLSST